MKFDLSELTVVAGQLVEVVFVNDDEMPHNFVLGAVGSIEAIGPAADAMATSPAGLAAQYVPEISQVLASSRLVDPGQSAHDPVPRAGAGRVLSLRLHVPRALAGHERRAESHRESDGDSQYRLTCPERFA